MPTIPLVALKIAPATVDTPPSSQPSTPAIPSSIALFPFAAAPAQVAQSAPLAPAEKSSISIPRSAACAVAQPAQSAVKDFPTPSAVLSQPRTEAPSIPTPSATQVFAGIEGSGPPAQESLAWPIHFLRFRFFNRDRELQQNEELRQFDRYKEPKSRIRKMPLWGIRLLQWLYPEFAISTQPQPPNQQPAYTQQTQFQTKPAISWDMQLIHRLYPEITFLRHRKPLSAPPDRRQARRLPTPGLVAYYFTGGPPRAHKLGNISVTGFYMHTDERWMPGTVIRMTLQMIDAKGEHPAESITVHSRVVRWGPDGEGFEFVLSGLPDEPVPLSYRRAKHTNHRHRID
jgi:hypothetical protein